MLKYGKWIILANTSNRFVRVVEEKERTENSDDEAILNESVNIDENAAIDSTSNEAGIDSTPNEKGIDSTPNEYCIMVEEVFTPTVGANEERKGKRRVSDEERSRKKREKNWIYNKRDTFFTTVNNCITKGLPTNHSEFEWKDGIIVCRIYSTTITHMPGQFHLMWYESGRLKMVA